MEDCEQAFGRNSPVLVTKTIFGSAKPSQLITTPVFDVKERRFSVA
jgi:hypothetical protein